MTGREFKSARESVALKDADLAVAVVDPLGQTVQRQQVRFSGTQGADARFALADGAPGGGYELRMTMGDDTYTAAFRVSEYQKPHFEIGVLPAKPDFKTGEAVEGQLQLNYPDGKPVANARVSLTARAQKLTMIEGDLDYGGQFPLKLTQAELVTDAKGVAKFALPAADQPSRYVITALATDGAAYRVRPRASCSSSAAAPASAWRRIASSRVPARTSPIASPPASAARPSPARVRRRPCRAPTPRRRAPRPGSGCAWRTAPPPAASSPRATASPSRTRSRARTRCACATIAAASWPPPATGSAATA